MFVFCKLSIQMPNELSSSELTENASSISKMHCILHVICTEYLQTWTVLNLDYSGEAEGKAVSD